MGDGPVKRSSDRGHRRALALPLAAAGLAVATVVMLVTILDGTAPAAGRAGPTAYQRQLQGQVQDAAGAPRAGRDPANQPQTSLAEAASRPHVMPGKGRGTKVTAPRPPRTVIGDPRRTGVLSNGCATGYGDVGQCVPARAPGGKAMTCAILVGTFPDGIAVTGRDRLKLDTDGDKVACGPGDKGVPEHHHH